MRLKLFWKLGLAALAALIVGLVAVDVYLSRALREDYIREGFQNLDSLARIATPKYPPAALTVDVPAIREWAAWVAPGGVRVTVIAADGRVLADSEEDPDHMENHAGRPEIREAFAQGRGRAVRYSDTVKHELLYLAVRHPADPAVVLRFASKLAEVDQAMAQVRRRLVFGSLFALLVGGGVSLLLFRSQAVRVERLKQFSARVAEGDFRPMAVEHEGDELTGLAQALNEAAARMESTIATLTEERNRSAAILRSMVEGVAVISRDGKLLFINQAMAGILGAGPLTLEGRTMVEVIRQSDLLAVVQQVLAAPRGAAVPAASEVMIHAPGSAAAQRSYVAVAAPVHGDPAEGGGPHACVLVLHDITELRRLERVRRDFVANISHEFKTPLTAIQGFAETLLGGALDDAQNRGLFLEIIRDHAARLGRLTDDLLKLSAIEAGRLELNFARVNVGDVVESCVETSRFAASRKKIEMRAELAADLPTVHADVEKLSEALQNLVDNAVQYTPAGGRITVSASLSDANPGHIAVAVTDTGIGIPRDQQQRIFERFYRVDAARSREAGGTGLGLSIARHIVEAHGGRIELQSDVGAGSTFCILLPIKA